MNAFVFCVCLKTRLHILWLTVFCFEGPVKSDVAALNFCLATAYHRAQNRQITRQRPFDKPHIDRPNKRSERLFKISKNPKFKQCSFSKFQVIGL